MNKKIYLLILIVLACFISLSCISQEKNMLTEQEKKGGWQLLFDGNTMNGWRTYKNKPTNSWEVSNGELH